MKIITKESINDITIEELKKQKLILFFYPKASTPG